MIICVLYTAFVEVLKVTYLLKELHPEIDVTLDVVFGLDILFQFFCGWLPRMPPVPRPSPPQSLGASAATD